MRVKKHLAAVAVNAMANRNAILAKPSVAVTTSLAAQASSKHIAQRNQTEIPRVVAAIAGLEPACSVVKMTP